MLNVSYWLFESLISSEMCDLIIKETNWSEAQTASIQRKSGKEIDIEVRKTEVVFIPQISVAGSILRNAITTANFEARWNYKLTSVEQIQMTKYADGGHYKYHKDITVPNAKNEQRKLSAVLFLSNPEEYDGGEFLFKDFDIHKTKLNKGSIIVFPSFLDHKVTPVTSGERYTAVCWASGPAFS